MAPLSLQLGRGMRQLFQCSAASTSSSSTAITASQAAPRFISTSAPVWAAKAKQATQKKKSTVKRKESVRGPRGSGKKRVADTGASFVGTSQFFTEKPDFSNLETFTAEKLVPDAVGQHMAWSTKALAAFNSFGLPQELKREFAIQPRPRTLVRQNTLQMLERLEDAAQNVKSERVFLTGASGCGKSTLMAQSVSHALDQGWVVIYVPRAIELINSSTEYAYSAPDRVYVQPAATKALLTAMLEVNQDAFKNIFITESLDVEGPGALDNVKTGTSLDKVVLVGLQEKASDSTRHKVLKLVLETLGAQTQVPVLVAIDEVQALFRTSLYRDPDYKTLESYELGVPRVLLSLLTGKMAGKRTMVLCAASDLQTEFASPVELLVALAGSNEEAVSKVAHAYTKINEEHLANAQAVKPEMVEVGDRLTLEEAAALFSQIKDERRMWSSANDELFVAKCVETGSNARRFIRSLTTTLQ